MEVNCSAYKCLIYGKISEQLTNNSARVSATTTSAINGGNIKQLLTMHHEDVININNNDMIFDKLLENLSFHNANTDFNDTTGNIVDGPYRINFTDLIFVVLFCLLIIIVIIGNTLVILSVLTTRRLRTVTNLFVTSLAVADWLVGIFVMPPAVAYYLMGLYNLYHFPVVSCSIKNINWIFLQVPGT